MAKLLYIEASPRKLRSHSIAVAEEFLATYRAAHAQDELEKLDVWDVRASGDGYAPATGFEAFDLQQPYLKLWLGFLGINVAATIEVGSTLFPQRFEDTSAK